MAVSGSERPNPNRAPASAGNPPAGQPPAPRGVAAGPDCISSLESCLGGLLRDGLACIASLLTGLWQLLLRWAGEDEEISFAGPQAAPNVQNINADQPFVSPFVSFEEGIQKWSKEWQPAFGHIQFPYDVLTVVRVYNKKACVFSKEFPHPNQQAIYQFEDLQRDFRTIDQDLQKRKILLTKEDTKIGILLCVTKLRPDGRTYDIILLDQTLECENNHIFAYSGERESAKSGVGKEGIRTWIRDGIRLLDNLPSDAL